ncbi:GntR family transcriptional regulator [Desulfovibrio sp. JC022]|uniref:GntR family transcriptional regulator n=1 Tax=Desulfovibrio sp. JC022 TaxID=2593642 RepID=UPI0013D0F8E4|nr:GntR family transcriptional regulator [Desulfovibrio sp. JC022]NDV22591.1 GntR family transcriptional regulator [Desulfovibrio sp. JC022]
MVASVGLKRRVLRDDVVEHIVGCILKGYLKPGDKIVETRVSRELQVSQGAVREAIRDLTARGFVETEPYKGSRVKVLSSGELYEYYAVRSELEPLALGWGFELDRIDAEALMSSVESMFDGVEHKDMTAVGQADLDFHRTIMECSGNGSLVRSWEALANDYWMFTLAKQHVENGVDLSVHAQEHKDIVDAVNAGDLELMKDRLKNHFSL